MIDPSPIKPRFSSSPPAAILRPRLRPLLFALSALCVALGLSGQARAQADDADVNVQMPNVLLLVDTSGSMEYKTSATAFPDCKYDATGKIPSWKGISEKSRWIDLVEVLTGSITDYQCQRLDRGSASFKNEYKVSSSLPNSPYDFLYANPYNRPLSGECAIGPGTISSTNPAAFLSDSFNYHTYNSPGTRCTFSQASDGILDSFLNSMRFGLMTFDTDPSVDQGELGTYSYVVGTPHSGKPIGCTTASPMEVGARNASAPPWEGRLIPFGDPQPGEHDYEKKNEQVQQVLRASRPYGATPIAGMLSDARDFLWNDTSFDPVNTSQRFGPASDPYRGCRNTVVMLLTDGQPNMDLRGHCTGNDCPFPLPEDIAHDLLVSGTPPVKTYVVGFALQTLKVGTSTIDCAALKPADLDTTPSALCTANPDNTDLQTCCNLARIALAGDNKADRHAYFANDREQLRKNISSILSQQFPTTSRTQAAFSGVTGSNTSPLAPASSYRFFSNFQPMSDQPWAGAVVRERWTCDKTTLQASRVEPDPAKGDLFADNLNSLQGGGLPRTFYTVQAAPSADGAVHSERSVRPNVSGSDPDGVGAVTGTLIGATDATFVGNTSPASMGLPGTGGLCDETVNGTTTTLSAVLCRDKYLKWLVGLANDAGVSRCKPPPNQTPAPQYACNLLGDIYHATPRIVNTPNELTSDDTYRGFQGAYATRPMVLYTSSNDGLLHAFKVASNFKNDSQGQVDKLGNNELWAFIPPQVLPHIPSEYPGTHQLLLDGVSVVKDVVARKTSGTYPYVFERTTADAVAGASANTTWRTILVQGFGGTYPGYFALDITNPEPGRPLNSETGGPKFLWQLTSDTSGKPLFGSGGATPIITTLLVDEDGSGAREVPVAILPGGSGGAGTEGPNSATPGCVRASTDLSKFVGYPPRPRVPCYDTNLGARSLTVVRLDNGKIIRSFRRSKLEAPTGIQSRVIEAPLDSPITGEPVAFPSDVGSVADRIFVGDQDGTLWKVDVSSKSPDQWTMSLFWDAFPAVQIHSKKGEWNSGQRIATAPVLSVDDRGNLTLAFSTGDQGSLGAATGMLNYVWSLRDLPNASHTFLADPLWLQQFVDGERVTGPISLFNSYLYFSTVTPPPPGNACQATNGARVWGMHYMIPRDGEGSTAVPPDRTVGGKAAPFILANFQSTAQFVTDTTLLGTGSDKKAVIYGATVAQVPTCYAEETSADVYLGGGTRITDANPGAFQLVIQTGSATLSTGGRGEAAAPKGAIAVTLPKLATPARIEAWASIVE
jgi:type IV pilus assembly protein PilY1